MCIFYNFATFAKISSNISICNGNVQARILHDRCGKASTGLGYEKKRPSGLVLDASGAFTVANLLDGWGRALCLTEAGVMAAAKKHMFKDSKEPGSRCQKEAAEEDQAGIPRSSGPPEIREEIQGSKGLLERPGSARIKGTSG